MLNPPPIVYVMSMQAMAKYFREEGIPIPAWCLPGLATHDASIRAGVLSLVRTLRRMWATHSLVKHHPAHGVRQGVEAG